jgi:hypothetical protein
MAHPLHIYNHHISPGNLFSCFGTNEVMQGVQKEMQLIEVTNTETVQNNYHYFTILWFHNSDFLLSHPNTYCHVYGVLRVTYKTGSGLDDWIY